MTSKKVKLGLGNTMSGNLNKRQTEYKLKQIDMSDFDFQMMSPQFLQSKTLKKPLKQYQIQLDKTNTLNSKAQSKKIQKIGKFVFQFDEKLINSKEDNENLKKTQKIEYKYLTLDQKNIKPAYKPLSDNFITKIQNSANVPFEFNLDNQNTIFSAIIKKGLKDKKSITIVENQEKNIKVAQKQSQRKVGKAESKLKQLFNKEKNRIQNEQKVVKKPRVNEDIEQEIQQSINDYADEQFEKYSQGSMIKESIRESIGYSSAGKHARSQIIEEIQESIRNSNSASKEQIQQFIASYKSSGNGIKQQIIESISASKKSGGQEVYQQIFQEYEDQLSKSKSGFKKSSNFRESADFSKSFRKKTSVIKSIRLAEQINFQASSDKKQDLNKLIEENNDKFANNLIAEKNSLMKKKADLADLFKKKDSIYLMSEINKNLFYEFKIEISKLLTSQNFESKLKKLTSFINSDLNDLKSVNVLEDKILKNILQQVEKIKKPEIGSDQIQKLKQQYDAKLKTLLKDQQINLRVEMDKKIHEKDMEIKKMIAQLQLKFQGKALSSSNVNNFIEQSKNFSNGNQFYEVDSDYSIDSDNISWKADLWEVLPEYEKRKLYEKQSKQVTNFLTNIMLNQLKEQSLNRSLDISFEFPDDVNNLNEKVPNLSSVKSKNRFQSENIDSMPKSAFNRKEIQQNISMTIPTKKESIFPDFVRPKPKVKEDYPFSNKKQNVNQFAKIEGQNPIQPTKKDLFMKEKIIQLLSKYKSSYLRKKNDVIRKILKTMKPKDSKKNPQENLLSTIQEFTILAKQDIQTDHLIYVRAFEEELIWALIHIMTKNENKKTQIIEEEMRKNYDRLIVVCQLKTIEQCEQKVTLDLYEDKKYCKLKNNINLMEIKACPLQISFKDEAIQLIETRKQRKVKDELVEEIIKSLMSEFSKEFPKRKK